MASPCRGPFLEGNLHGQSRTRTHLQRDPGPSVHVDGTMGQTGSAMDVNKYTIIGEAITVAGAVGLAAGLATVDIVGAIREKRG